MATLAVVELLIIVLLLHFWPKKPELPRGKYVEMDDVVQHAEHMVTRIARVRLFAERGELAGDMAEAVIELVKESSDFYLGILGGEDEKTETHA